MQILLVQVVAEHGKTLTADVLGNMPFVEACVKECMRIDPAVSGLWREALEDLDIDGYLVKKVPNFTPYLCCLKQ